jgi:hypothetical protein
MKNLSSLVAAALLALTSVKPSIAGDNPNPYCHYLGGLREVTCMPSMSVLMARREEFDNKLVMITGYFVYAKVPILFFNTDSFMNSDVSNGLVIFLPKDDKLQQKLFLLNHTYVKIWGRFKAKPIELSEYGAYFSGGALTDVSEVNEAVNPWGESVSPPPGIKKDKAH